ncbi:hypothetical protein L7F22_030043 [Adiantum nelumboides]|nr:hypothetical protein [Adiantum nelumboides]
MRYAEAQLVEINAHSLFSKWFSESGKMVTKLFQKIHTFVEEGDTLVFLLIDEVESLASARQAALSGSEPSDSIRMMIRAELSLLRSDIEKEMHTQVEIYKKTMYADIRKELDTELMSKKEEMYKSLKIEMQNSMRAEAIVIECVVQKKLEDALLAFESWKSNTEKCMNGKDALIEELKGELAECKKEQKMAVKDLEGKLVTLSEGMEARETTQEKTADPQLQEELVEMKRQMETLKAEEAQKTQVASSWAERLFKIQEKVEEAEKWIADAKQGKGPMADGTPTSTIINMTIEEEQKRKTRAMHVRITGVKDNGNVEEEVKGLAQRMGILEPLHTSAWRVGKKGVDSKGNARDRALILRFPTLEARKDFLKKRHLREPEYF